MAENDPKHPSVKRMEEFESLLTSQPTIAQLEEHLQGLSEELDRPGALDEAMKTAAKIIRAKIKAIKKDYRDLVKRKEFLRAGHLLKQIEGKAQGIIETKEPEKGGVKTAQEIEGVFNGSPFLVAVFERDVGVVNNMGDTQEEAQKYEIEDEDELRNAVGWAAEELRKAYPKLGNPPQDSLSFDQMVSWLSDGNVDEKGLNLFIANIHIRLINQTREKGELEGIRSGFIEDPVLHAIFLKEGNDRIKDIDEIGAMYDDERKYAFVSAESLKSALRRAMGQLRSELRLGQLPKNPMDIQEVCAWLQRGKVERADLKTLVEHIEKNLLEESKKPKEVAKAPKVETPKTEIDIDVELKKNPMARRILDLEKLGKQEFGQLLLKEGLMSKDDPEANKKIAGVFERWQRVKQEVIKIASGAKTEQELKMAERPIKELLRQGYLDVLSRYIFERKKIGKESPEKKAGHEQKPVDITVRPAPIEQPNKVAQFPLTTPKVDESKKTIGKPAELPRPALPTFTSPIEISKPVRLSDPEEKEIEELIEGTKTEENKRLYRSLEAFTKNGNNLASRQLCLNTMQLVETGPIDDPKRKKLIEKITQLFEATKLMADSQTHVIPEKALKSLIEDGLKEIVTEIFEAGKAMEEEKMHREASDKKKFLLTMALGALEGTLEPVFEILEMDSESEGDFRKREFLRQIQPECKKFIEGIHLDRLRGKDLEELEAEAEKIKKSYQSKLARQIETYRKKAGVNEAPSTKIIPSPAPETPEVIVNPVPRPSVPDFGTVEATPKSPDLPSSGSQVAPSVPKDTPTKSLEPLPVPHMVAKPPEKVELKRATLDEAVSRMLKSVLSKESLVKDDDPVCQAINTLVNEKKIDLEHFEKFLKNPTSSHKKIDETKINAEKAKLGPDAAKVTDAELKASLEGELAIGNEFLDSIRGNRQSPETEKKRGEALERKRTILKLLIDIEALIQQKSRTSRYDTPRHVLSMALFFADEKKAELSAERLSSEIDSRVEREKDWLYSGLRSGINRVGFFLKPTLESTLKALAQDRELAKIGENPAEKLAELAKMFNNTSQDVKKWVDSLPGGIKQHALTTVPRLVAYLELAIRDGHASHLMVTGDAKKLVNHLKGVRNGQIKAEVENEFEKNKTLKDTDRALLYVTRLNEADKTATDLSREIFSRNFLKSAVIKAGSVAGIAAIGALAPIPFLAALPMSISLPAYISSYFKDAPVSEKNRPLLRSVAVRTFMANALALGGAALFTPLAIPMGVLGVLSPNIWKNRKALFTKSVAGSKTAWQKGIKPALPYIGKGTLGLFKWTVGLPFTLTYKAIKGSK